MQNGHNMVGIERSEGDGIHGADLPGLNLIKVIFPRVASICNSRFSASFSRFSAPGRSQTGVAASESSSQKPHMQVTHAPVTGTCLHKLREKTAILFYELDKTMQSRPALHALSRSWRPRPYNIARCMNGWFLQADMCRRPPGPTRSETRNAGSAYHQTIPERCWRQWSSQPLSDSACQGICGEARQGQHVGWFSMSV